MLLPAASPLPPCTCSPQPCQCTRVLLRVVLVAALQQGAALAERDPWGRAHRGSAHPCPTAATTSTSKPPACRTQVGGHSGWHRALPRPSVPRVSASFSVPSSTQCCHLLPLQPPSVLPVPQPLYSLVVPAAPSSPWQCPPDLVCPGSAAGWRVGRVPRAQVRWGRREPLTAHRTLGGTAGSWRNLGGTPAPALGADPEGHRGLGGSCNGWGLGVGRRYGGDRWWVGGQWDAVDVLLLLHVVLIFEAFPAP